MKILLPLRCVAIIFSAFLLSSGCEKKTAAGNPDSQGNKELHENTKPLQAADLVRYNGTKLKKSVDKIIQDNAKHNKELEDATERH